MRGRERGKERGIVSIGSSVALVRFEQSGGGDVGE